MSIRSELTTLPVFETERLILRQITDSEQDGKDCLEFINDYQVYKTWGLYDENRSDMQKPEPITSVIQPYRDTIEEFMSKSELTWLIIRKDTKKVIGEILLYDFQLEYQAQIGYRIRHDEWNKGFASEAAKEILRYAFMTLDLKRLELKCFASNIGSKRVAEKLGFTQEGLIHQGVILEVITDYYIYGLLSENYQKKEGITE